MRYHPPEHFGMSTTQKKSISLKPPVMSLPGVATRLRAEGNDGPIRALRAESNRAIAEHDALRAVDSCLSTVHVSVGDGQPMIGRDAVRAAFERSFADSTFLTYERTPSNIQMGESGVTASESGTWQGKWNKPDGVMTMSGTYLAVWRKMAGRWQLQSELFATLNCTGSRECSPA